jgi:hypothetical protein
MIPEAHKRKPGSIILPGHKGGGLRERLWKKGSDGRITTTECLIFSRDLFDFIKGAALSMGLSFTRHLIRAIKNPHNEGLCQKRCIQRKPDLLL